MEKWDGFWKKAVFILDGVSLICLQNSINKDFFSFSFSSVIIAGVQHKTMEQLHVSIVLYNGSI